MTEDTKADPTRTYVLEETALTKKKNLEELAELAMGKEPENQVPKDDQNNGTDE